jgi:hypothetical protein
MENLIRGWGRNVPEELHGKIAVTWGARAIYTGQYIDLLHDRMTWTVPGQELDIEKHRPLVNSLDHWLSKKGLPFLRNEAKGLYPDDDRVVTLDDGRFHIEASPQRSFGYLYIRAWELRSDDETLHEAIASRGWTSQKETDDQRRTIYNERGERLGSFDAKEAWEHLRKRQK